MALAEIQLADSDSVVTSLTLSISVCGTESASTPELVIRKSQATSRTLETVISAVNAIVLPVTIGRMIGTVPGTFFRLCGGSSFCRASDVHPDTDMSGASICRMLVQINVRSCSFHRHVYYSSGTPARCH